MVQMKMWKWMVKRRKFGVQGTWTVLKTKFLNQTNGRFYIVVTCDQYAYERMVAFSRANQIRLTRAARTLQERHDAEAAQGNWEEAANCLRALYEVQALMDIA
jgi:hypothetical protein